MSFNISLDASNPNEVAQARHIEAVVKGPNDANRLLILTGTAIVRLKGPGEDEGQVRNRGLSITLLESLNSPTQFIKSATFASLAAESSGAGDPEANDEWFFELSNASTVIGQERSLVLTATLAVGTDAVLLRMAYQANVLARA